MNGKELIMTEEFKQFIKDSSDMELVFLQKALRDAGDKEQLELVMNELKERATK